MDITSILQNSMSPDRQVGVQAEQQLAELEQQNAGVLMGVLSQELVDESKPDQTRQTAGLYLKNMLDAKNEHRKQELVNRWISMDTSIKSQIKPIIMQALSSANLHAGRAAAQVVSKVALIELPRNEWPDLIATLLANVGVQNSNLKISSLETLGYICDDIDPDVLGGQSNQILTAVIQGMNSAEPDLSVRLAATHSLNNALIFIKRNFEAPEERNFIMQTICEACVAQGDPNLAMRLKLSAFECLVKVADLYYDYLQDYMHALAQLTFEAIKSADEAIGRMAIEFWCTICDEEVELMSLEEDAQEIGIQPTRRCQQFIRAAVQPLTVLLLEKLTLIEDDYDEDNIASSAGTCLTLIANTVRDEAVMHVLPFVEANLGQAEWKLKASAILAFGFILEGPSEEKLRPLIHTATPTLIAAMKDPVEKVKDSAAWTLSRACEFHGPVMEHYLGQLMITLVEALRDEPRVANNACWAIHFLAQQYTDVGAAADTNPFSQYFSGVIESLLQCTQREDADEANLRISAYEVINTVISAGAKDTLPLTGQLIDNLLARLLATFSMPVMTAEGREEQSELQGLLCGVFTAITNKLQEGVTNHADAMMQMFLQVLTQNSASVHEEALLSISAVAAAVGPKFKTYTDPLMPHLMRGLKNHEEYEVCSVAVGVVGDMSRALTKDFANYAEQIITVLLENLQNTNLDNSVKPAILGVFGDIAMAIGSQFVRYLPTVMSVLVAAGQLDVDREDEDMVDYLNEIRESVCEAYIGLIQGLCEDGQHQQALQFAPAMFDFVKMVANDKLSETSVIKTAVALVGDLCSNLGVQVGACIDPTIVNLIKAAIANPDVEDAEYAYEALKKINPQFFLH